MIKFRILFLIIIFAIKFAHSQNDWFWQNPYPQANQLNCIYTENNNLLYSAGVCGMIIKSTNGGINWAVESSGTTYALNSMVFVNSQTGWAAGGSNFNGVILKTTNGGVNWITQFNDTVKGLYSIFFLNLQTGWVAGGYINTSTLLKTTNSGQNWISMPNNFNTWLYVIYFFNPSTGWTGGVDGAVFKTTDGGVSWSKDSVSQYGTISSIYFSSSDTGFVSGSGIYKTTNGGLNWVIKQNGGFYGLKFFNSNTGYTGTSNGYIYKTSNSGENWFSLQTGISEYLKDVNGQSDTAIWAVGWYGTIIKSTNAGANWNLQVTGPRNQALNSIQFLNSQTGWVVGSGPILKTTNSGTNWFILYNLTQTFYSVCFVNELTGWIGGRDNSNSVLLYTTDGGLGWTQLMNGYYSEVNDIKFQNAQTGFVIVTGVFSGGSTIYKTTNSGNNWNAVGGSYALNRMLFSSLSRGYAVGEGDALLTTNGGNNWINMNIGTSSILYSISFINDQTGWIGGQNVIIKTTDGGITWNTQINSIMSNFNAISFIDSKFGWTAGSLIYYTTNGGTNWFNAPGITTNNIGGIYFTSPTTGWMIGDYGSILKTTDCGGLLTGIKPISSRIPNKFLLFQNYPNPFNPSSKIKFQISKLGDVQLTIYDILGREVVTIVNEKLQPGTYEVEFDGSAYSSGVYFYKLTMGDASTGAKDATGPLSISKKMVLLK